MGSDGAAFFSDDYEHSRARFIGAAARADFVLSEYPLDCDGPTGLALSIDVARKGPTNAQKVLVVSCGTHGVEGFFGAAVQAAVLETVLNTQTVPEQTAIVLIHALNPYGFAFRRRVNEDNVDLNRNFLLAGQPFSGAPPAYRELDGLLNPKHPPSALTPFLLVAGPKLLKYGFSALKNAIAQGQYDFPQGVFFGGKAPSRSQVILTSHAREWLGKPERVLHIDFHTGLGPWGGYALCADLPVDGARVQQLRREFGSEHVQSYDPKGVLYEIKGGLGRFLEAQFPDTQYDCLLAEFGTYSSLKVLRAMRVENCVHLHAPQDAARNARAKAHLLEAFCPESESWRSTVVERGVSVVRSALRALA